MEDKQNICDLLCATLKATRNHEDIESITYSRDDSRETETATVKWENGGHIDINVSLDSGEAMIRDILNHIND